MFTTDRDHLIKLNSLENSNLTEVYTLSNFSKMFYSSYDIGKVVVLTIFPKKNRVGYPTLLHLEVNHKIYSLITFQNLFDNIFLVLQDIP